MKTVVISYSLTGNNEALANSIAKEFGVEHIKITESKPRAMGTIAKDMLFNITPKVKPIPETLDNYEQILFLGPVWMGHVAAPLRVYLKYLKKNPCKYAFISISGGADGPNPKLAGELKKRVGEEPIALIDLHIADLLPHDPKPTRKDTSKYRLNDIDVKSLTNTIMNILRETMEK